jgi:hypothetical protein
MDWHDATKKTTVKRAWRLSTAASLYVREYAVKLVIDSIVKMLSRYTGIYNFASFVFEFICVHLRLSAAGLLLQFSFVLIGVHRRPIRRKGS